MEPNARVILLASASPRRKEILESLGHAVIVRPVDIDEREHEGEAPDAYLDRIVSAKLEAALALPLASKSVLPSDRPIDAILVADTIVVVDGRILQKPADQADGRRMLRALSGRAHRVTTRFAIAHPLAEKTPQRTHVESVPTAVLFRALGEDEIEAYLASAEGRDKAGGYAIQGRGASFIARMEGSYGAVVGLPSCEVTLALRAFSSRS